MRLSTPSIIFWTRSTSEYPMRALFEISNSPLGPGGVCSPLAPRASRPSELQCFSIFFMPQALCSLGSLSITEARRPVPRLEGQVQMLPRWSSYLRGVVETMNRESGVPRQKGCRRLPFFFRMYCKHYSR